MKMSTALLRGMTERFTTTKDRMVCVTCHGNLKAGSTAIKAGGKFWCLDHFSCLECGVSLRLVSGDGGEYAEDDSVFLEEDEENIDLEVANNDITSEKKKRSTVYQKDGLLYCERDYKKLFVPRCSSCRGHIMKDCLKALNKTWHPECFSCTRCHTQFGRGQGFHEKDSEPYCRSCYIEVTCSKCAGCDQAITDKAVKAMEREWHVGCFVCKECNSSFVGQKNFYCVDGKPVCSKCV